VSVTYDRSVVSQLYSINKTGRHDITEILLKVSSNTITLTHKNIIQVLQKLIQSITDKYMRNVSVISSGNEIFSDF